jgi:hypothetical protein
MTIHTRIQIQDRLPIIVLFVVLIAPSLSLGQQIKEDKNPIGFRTDLGINLSIGGHVCLGSSGENWLACSGNNAGWTMGTGLAIGATVRPFKFFSLGIDGAYMAMRPIEGTETERDYKRFYDISFGAVFKGHLPIQIKRFLLDIGLGVRFAFVNGYLKAKPNAIFQEVTGDDSHVYFHRHFGPEITPLLDLMLFLVPKIGIGMEMRLPMTVYTEVCFDQGNSVICRGALDDPENKAKAPIKLFFGLHLIYYL